MTTRWLAGSLIVILIIVISAGFVLSRTNDSNQIHDIFASVTEQPSSQHLPQIADSLGFVSHSMSLNVPLRANPEKILVYKTLPPNASRNRLDEYAKILKVNGTFREGTQGISLQSEDLIFGVEIGKVSGDVRYLVQNRPDDTLDSPDKLPSDEEAVMIATQFLKDNNIYPEGAAFRKTEQEYERSTDKNGTEIRHAGRIVVWFGRTLNNLDVKGTQLYVEIGGNGDVIGYLANWREYMPTKELPIKSPEAAFEDLKQEGLRTSQESPSISITNVTLAYRTKAGAYEEEYLEPIWIFSGTASADKTSSESVSKYIPALTGESVKSLTS